MFSSFLLTIVPQVATLQSLPDQIAEASAELARLHADAEGAARDMAELQASLDAAKVGTTLENLPPSLG